MLYTCYMAKHPNPLCAGNLEGNNQLTRCWSGFGIILAAIVVSLTSLAAPARASAMPWAPGIQIIGPDEVLREHTAPLPTGDLGFRESDGALVRLIVSVEDPEILNRGDGVFHPADEAAVDRALQELPSQYLRALWVEIYLLPYPRAGRLSSSADTRAIYLSPGVRSYDEDQVAFLVTHEIGHTFHRRFMPDSLTDLWAEWAALRGVADISIFNEDAAHAYRPHEIFAEDFRVLFGGPAARSGAGIENPQLPSPDDVPGLREFYERLAGGRPLPAVAALHVSPNPVRAGQTLVLRLPQGEFVRSGGPTASLVDVSGRVVAELAFRLAGDATFTSSLDHLEGTRSGPAAGAYWLRVMMAPGSAPAIVPIRILP
jgi:hypothetical protein